MSLYQVNKLCYDLKLATNREAYQADPRGYLRRYHLDEDERTALDARDYAWLFDHGVNFLVLSTFATQNGVAGLPAMIDVMREQYESMETEG